MHGLVVRNTGYSYTVKSDAGEVFDCKVKGNFRIRGIRTTNPVAIGDRVTFTPYEQQTLPSPSLQGGSGISSNENTNEQSNYSLPAGRVRGGSFALILGNEVKGVHQEVVDASDGCIEIPQYGTKHSLNVSTTAGIVIWEFAKRLLM